MAKDLGLAMDNAANSKSSTPLGLLAQSLYLQKQEMGDGKKDFSSVIELMKA
jgi:3-hydroxyisobutyrate dehydrogenase